MAVTAERVSVRSFVDVVGLGQRQRPHWAVRDLGLRCTPQPNFAAGASRTVSPCHRARFKHRRTSENDNTPSFSLKNWRNLAISASSASGGSSGILPDPADSDSDSASSSLLDELELDEDEEDEELLELDDECRRFRLLDRFLSLLERLLARCLLRRLDLRPATLRAGGAAPCTVLARGYRPAAWSVHARGLTFVTARLGLGRRRRRRCRRGGALPRLALRGLVAASRSRRPDRAKDRQFIGVRGENAPSEQHSTPHATHVKPTNLERGDGGDGERLDERDRSGDGAQTFTVMASR